MFIVFLSKKMISTNGPVFERLSTLWHADSLYLQVRGFPYDTTTEKMAAYFELSEEEFTGADIAVGIRGKPCGEFFFQATDEAVAVKVCGRHKELYGDTDSCD